MLDTVDSLTDGISQGDRLALTRAITLAESSRADHIRQAEKLLDRIVPHHKSTLRVGVSGWPGVGKSTLIEALGLHLIGQNRKVAVLAIDPSSQRQGGAILGDKTRMPRLAAQPNAFVRPSSANNNLGGIAPATNDSVLLCEAAGYNVVMIETVGVGQSEVAVANVCDVFVLVVTPNSGDDLQAIKRGVMELADIIAVNKADGELAAAAAATMVCYQTAAELIQPKWPDWQVKVQTCSAAEGNEIGQLGDAICSLADQLSSAGLIGALRADQAARLLETSIAARLLEKLKTEPDSNFETALEQVRLGLRSPRSAATELVGPIR